jgi:hypothetical protein
MMSTASKRKAPAKVERRIRILPDESPESPREWDNLGSMACWHNRYTLGDEQPREEPREFRAALPEGTVVLPLYLMDHSGLAMSVGPFGCPWDSGQVGLIYCTPESREAMGTPPELVEQVLRGEVETYSQFLGGDVWGFVCEERKAPCECCERDSEWEEVGSCWGFYGSDVASNGMREHWGEEFKDAPIVEPY